MCHKGKPTLLILNMATKCYQFHIQRSMAIFQGGKEEFGVFFFFLVNTPGGISGESKSPRSPGGAGANGGDRGKVTTLRRTRVGLELSSEQPDRQRWGLRIQ